MKYKNTSALFDTSNNKLNLVMTHNGASIFAKYEANAAPSVYSEMKHGGTLTKSEYLNCIAYGEVINKLISLYSDELDSLFEGLKAQIPSYDEKPLILERTGLFTYITKTGESRPANLDQVYLYVGYSFLYGDFEKTFNELVAAQNEKILVTIDKVFYKEGFTSHVSLASFNTLKEVDAVNSSGEVKKVEANARALRTVGRDASVFKSETKTIVDDLDTSKISVYFKGVKPPLSSAFVKVIFGDVCFNYGVSVVKGGTHALANNTVKLQAIGELVTYLGERPDWLNLGLSPEFSECKDVNSTKMRELGYHLTPLDIDLKAYSLPSRQNGRSTIFKTSEADLTGFELIASNYGVLSQCKPSLDSANEVKEIRGKAIDTVIIDEVEVDKLIEALDLTPEQQRIAELEAELAKLKGINTIVNKGLVYAMKGKIYIGNDSFPVEKGRPAIAYIGLKLLELRATVDIPIESLYVKGSNFAAGTTAYGNYGIPAWDASFRDGNERKPFKEIMRIYKFVSVDMMLTDLREYLKGDFNVSEYAINRVGLAIYLAMLVGSNSFNKLEAVGFSKADYEAYSRFLAGYKAYV